MTVLTAVIDRQLRKTRRANARRQWHEERASLSGSGDETYDDSDVKRRLDVETVVGTLDDRQRRVCDLLSRGHSKSAIARELGREWHTVDRIVRGIRHRFEEHGFGEG